MSEVSFGEIRTEIRAEIRPCREEDLPGLEWMGLFTAHRRTLRQAFEAQERGHALLLLAVSKGFAIAQIFIDFARRRREGAAVLWAVRTFHPLQGTGIGSRMLEAAEQAIRARGYKCAELGVERHNRSAIRFYERHGWQRIEPFEETVVHAGDGWEQTEVIQQWLLRKPLREGAQAASRASPASVR